MNPYLAEFIGTTVLIIFGYSVVANVVLARTKGLRIGPCGRANCWRAARRLGQFRLTLIS